MPADTRTTIRGLDPELYQRLRVHAVRNQMTIGDAVNDAIRWYLDGKMFHIPAPPEKGAPER